LRIADLLAGMIVGAGITGVVALATRWLSFTGDFVLGLTTGLISSAVVVVVLGIVRAPHVVLEVGDVADADYPHGRFRFVHVRVSNPGLLLWRWQLRRPATACRAELTYGDIGAHAGRFTIDGRWVSLPEPVQQVPGGRAVLDVGAVFSRPREVVTANDAVLLDVAIKQDGVTDCFAFNNRSYLFPPNWSNPAWALSSATYWVSVRIVAAEIEEVRVFYLVNQGNQRNGLRLEPTVPR